MDKLAAIRERLAKCCIPSDASADWDGTNHYEIHSNNDWFWLMVPDLFAVDNGGDLSATEYGKRMGAVLDYAAAYRRDVAALLAEIDGRDDGRSTCE